MILTTKNDNELTFRKAAASGDLITLKQLLPLVDINASGADSKQTALHRAVQNNKIEAFKLLFSAGASLVKKNKDNQTPTELATTDNMKKIIESVLLAEKAMQTVHTIFPAVAVLDQNSGSAFEAHRLFQERVVNTAYTYMQELSATLKDTALTRLKEPSHKNTTTDMRNKWSIQLSDYIAHIGALHQCHATLAHNSSNFVAACGEATRTAFASLYCQTPLKHTVELILMSAPQFPNYNHAFLILNREKAQPDNRRREYAVPSLNEWGDNALVCDPQLNRLFFSKYIDVFPDKQMTLTANPNAPYILHGITSSILPEIDNNHVVGKEIEQILVNWREKMVTSFSKKGVNILNLLETNKLTNNNNSNMAMF